MKALRIEDNKPAPVNAPPLGAGEFSALMEKFVPFAKPLRIAVAVSGGPDSMALAFCAKQWVAAQGGRLLAFIVDHKLRLESSGEAKQTKEALEAIGIDAEILRWQHPPVISKLHETARRARYHLLAEACRRHSVERLMLAHHAQDQAETILMRLAKGSGIDGLAGMPVQTMINGIQILRPLLAVPRERLAALCLQEKLPFVSDPSNVAVKYARGRLRRILPLLAEEGLTIDRLNDLGVRAAEAKAALDDTTGKLLRVAGKLDDGGVIHLNLEQFRSVPQATARRALITCLHAMRPEDYGSEYASLTRLADALIDDRPMTPCTLQGCLIGKNENEITIMREYAAIADGPVIKPGESVVWDSRWLITLSPDAKETYTIRALGNPTHEVLHRLASGLRRQIRQGRTRATLPSLWLNGVLALIPALPGMVYESAATAKPLLVWPPNPGR